MTNSPQMPPMPQPRDIPTESEILPFTSKKIKILKSGILLPAAATAIACLLLFLAKASGNAMQAGAIFSAYMLFIIFYACYVYSGIRTRIATYLIPCIILWVEFQPPVLGTFIQVFRHVLPGNLDLPESAGFIPHFIAMFFAAGLMEELMKAVPGLIGLFIFLRSANANGPGGAKSGWLSVSTPLEGVMLGLAAGVTFTMFETVFEYFPSAHTSTMKQLGDAGGWAFAFLLLLPRILDAVIGHAAWAAVTGYFIGLSALYPRSMWKLLPIGWLTAACLHAFWNSGEYLLGASYIWVSGAMSLMIFVSCFLKAKQLYVEKMGSNFAPSDSIVVGAPGSSPFGAASFSPGAAVQTPVPSQAPAQAAASTPRFSVACGQARFAIMPGQTIDFAVLFPGLGLAPPSLAEVSAHPQDATIIGLKNLTSVPWTATTGGGAVASVGPGHNLRLVDGETIAIGNVTILVQSL